MVPKKHLPASSLPIEVMSIINVPNQVGFLEGNDMAVFVITHADLCEISNVNESLHVHFLSFTSHRRLLHCRGHLSSAVRTHRYGHNQHGLVSLQRRGTSGNRVCPCAE